jgi:hypothetical protein
MASSQARLGFGRLEVVLASHYLFSRYYKYNESMTFITSCTNNYFDGCKKNSVCISWQKSCFLGENN